MAIDTPARIAVLGAGPIGLEAALYARFLGYDVDIYERGRVAENVLRWGHVRMFSPFGMNRSTLGLAALAAHDPSYHPPGDGELLTGREWAQRYLVPLAQSDLLADSLRLGSEVLAVGKDELLKGDHQDRADWDFRLLVRDASGLEEIRKADAVIDTTGVYQNANWLGQGGIPAVGEIALRGQIEYGLPDVLGADRLRYAGRQTLVIGCGYSAATAVTQLAELADEAPRTHVTWITRREPAGGAGPMTLIPHDPLAARDRLAQTANHLATTQGSGVTWWPGTFVERVRRDAAGGFETLFSGRHEGEHRFDSVVANVGYRPDNRLYSELQVHECYASGGPMKLAAALLKNPTADCLDQTSCGPEALITPEPNYYILGAKSYGRGSTFLISTGLAQIREVFTIIGDRADIDLYAGAQKRVKEAL